MNDYSEMPCPALNCNGKINYSAKLLISGRSFNCGNCGTEVSMDPSSYKVASQAMQEFENIKKNHF